MGKKRDYGGSEDSPDACFGTWQIFVDWDGAANPPKADNQMLGLIQLIYPAGRVSSSSANRSLFTTARNTMDFIAGWRASSDAACIIYQISTRASRPTVTNHTNLFHGTSFQKLRSRPPIDLSYPCSYRVDASQDSTTTRARSIPTSPTSTARLGPTPALGTCSRTA